MIENGYEEIQPDVHTGTAYSPLQTASIVENKAVTRARLRVMQTFILSILARYLCCHGRPVCHFITSDSALHLGITPLIMGMVFSLGLILVETAGAELFYR